MLYWGFEVYLCGVVNKWAATGCCGLIFFLLDQLAVVVSYVKGTRRLVEIDLLGIGKNINGLSLLDSRRTTSIAHKVLTFIKTQFLMILNDKRTQIKILNVSWCVWIVFLVPREEWHCFGTEIALNSTGDDKFLFVVMILKVKYVIRFILHYI